ncbi:hypothetical protein BaRGS_00032716 [Batillaria attramentaria]|uniref:RNA helicase n=1 Tax=Batillaria attramentaria TaxID=370345 RepID=A0ABD0JMF6_9CAEN
MFSAISKVVDFVLGTVLEHEDLDNSNSVTKGADNTDFKNASVSDAYLRHQDQPDVLLTAIVDEQEKNSESSTAFFKGKVTQVFCGHGLIDGEVYFSADSVCEGGVLQVGDQVNVVARQQHREGGWIAETVTVVHSSWEEDEEKPVVSTGEVGRVTQFRGGEGVINKNIFFDISSCLEGYRPHPGDWVTVELEADEEDDETKKEPEADGFEDYPSEKQLYAAKVAPLREWSFEGVISAAMADHGYIDEEVYFRIEACMNGYRPRKWDRVRVAAIESTQGKCSWRAVGVFPLSSDSASYRSKQTTNRYQSMDRGRGWVVPGQKPQMPHRKHNMSIPRKLPHYPVPESLRQCVMDQKELTEYSVHLTQMLSMENYIQRMSVLLHLEEIQMELDIREFDLYRVCLKRAGEFLALHVPGLAEGRPSVLIGDAVILSSPSNPDEPQYEGIVHELHSEEVLLKFNTDFHSRYLGEDYNVEFTFNRTPLRRCHQAAHLAFAHLGEAAPRDVQLRTPQVDLTSTAVSSGRNKPGKLQSSQPTQSNSRTPSSQAAQPVQNYNTSSSVANGLSQHSLVSNPTSDYSVPSRQPAVSRQKKSENLEASSPVHYLPNIGRGIQDAVTFFNPRLNDRQKAAVIQILLGQGRPLPYVIFGPPGTGKTITVVEAVLQILTCVPKSRIVICTPSNSAADLLAERLHLSGVVKTSDMGIPDSILPYCVFGHNLETVCRYRIIIATCNTAGYLYTAGLKEGHFTHAFIDEATEPECLIPAGLVAGADGQIILAGDPKQLGPIVMSPFAKMYGLQLSFLERLMDRLPYRHDPQRYSEHGGFHSALVTMLVNNYRCHPAILALPSQLFYYGQLQERASKSLTHTLVDWHLLPKPDIPVIFDGIRGEDVREGDSPSWFNPGETVRVVHYLQGLLGNNPPVAPDDIGIITPYRKQVEKIRMMIDRLAIPRVKVGSVEEFQGQERQAIIISTVRSNERLVNSDIRHVLGFLSNPKRFNVSITRAQALLVVIGNPHVLAQDEYWRAFIRMCTEKGCYRGCDLPDSLLPENPSDSIERKPAEACARVST